MMPLNFGFHKLQVMLLPNKSKRMNSKDKMRGNKEDLHFLKLTGLKSPSTAHSKFAKKVSDQIGILSNIFIFVLTYPLKKQWSLSMTLRL